MNRWLVFALLSGIIMSGECGVIDQTKSAAALANNEFGLDLLKHFHSDGKNVFFSPLSISTAVAMTSLGAAGNTLDEINSVFHYDDVTETSTDENVLHEFFKALISHYEEGSNDYTLTSANKLFAADKFELLLQFLNDVENYYKASVQAVDFSSGNAEEIINQWVAQHTNNKITELFTPGSISPDAALVLANAIYFKSNWNNQFSSSATISKFFHINTTEKHFVRIMVESDEYPYTKDEELNVQVLEMPYQGGNISMIVILPELGQLSNLISNLTVQKFKDIVENLSKTQVRVYFPKFDFETKYSLAENLQQLGVKELFSDTADLSRISNSSLKVSKIIHKATIKVDEDGTEAAAATGIEAIFASLPVHLPVDYPEFIADHPFIFFIVDKSSKNLVLFAGVLYRPEQWISSSLW